MNSPDEKTLDVQGVAFEFDQIFSVVDKFYTKVQHDPLLKVPFQSVHDWPEHVQRLTHFWWIRFGGKPYMDPRYNPVQKHFLAGFNEVFLAQWLTLFHRVINEQLNPVQANFWVSVSQRMGEVLSMKNEMARQQYEHAQGVSNPSANTKT